MKTYLSVLAAILTAAAIIAGTGYGFARYKASKAEKARLAILTAEERAAQEEATRKTDRDRAAAAERERVAAEREQAWIARHPQGMPASVRTLRPCELLASNGEVVRVLEGQDFDVTADDGEYWEVTHTQPGAKLKKADAAAP